MTAGRLHGDHAERQDETSETRHRLHLSDCGFPARCPSVDSVALVSVLRTGLTTFGAGREQRTGCCGEGGAQEL